MSVEVLGVDRLSKELRGKLLVDELAELKVVKLMRTLVGLCLIFWKVPARELFEGLSERAAAEGLSSFGEGLADKLVEIGLPVILESTTGRPSLSVSFPILRLGDGDLDEDIHDFLANVANDSETVLVLLSLVSLEIEGTGGTSLGVGITDS